MCPESAAPIPQLFFISIRKVSDCKDLSTLHPMEVCSALIPSIPRNDSKKALQVSYAYIPRLFESQEICLLASVRLWNFSMVGQN